MRIGHCLILSLTAFLLSTNILHAQPCNMGGVYKIGPAGNFATLTAALDTLRIKGLSGAVTLELKANYVSTGETFPLNFGGIPCMDNTKTLTLRPEAGSGVLQITATGGSYAINLSNARYVTIDGRAGGTGTTRSLTINHFNSTVVYFSNDASYNNLRYLNLNGNGILMSGSTATVTNGNIENTIEFCSISKSTPIGSYGFQSQGSLGKKNRNNKLLNNLISNYFNGIILLANNEDWEIRENHLFNIATINSIYKGIGIYDSTSGGFQVLNNVIGGSSFSAGGAANNYTNFTGIEMMTSNTRLSSIQGNQIRNFKITTSNFGAMDAGIHLRMGKINCGNLFPNIIGTTDGTRTIQIDGQNDILFSGIAVGEPWSSSYGVDTCMIENNIIGGINAIQTNFNFVHDNYVYGIYVKTQRSGHVEIKNNTIGHPTSYQNILNNLGNFGEVRTYGVFVDQLSVSNHPENLIQGNEIANLAGAAEGIRIWSGKVNILQNNIHHLYSDGDGATSFSAPNGIFVIQGEPGGYISGNNIHSIKWTGQISNVTGITLMMTNQTTIEKNTIHSIWSQSPGSGSIRGIYTSDYDKNHIIRNNMIRLGLDSSGTSFPGDNVPMYGISFKPDSTQILHNSVYITGQGSTETAALQSRENVVAGNSRILNNIFVNNRSVPGSSFYYHYALKYEGGLLSTNQYNYNIYYSSGNQNFLAYFQTIPFNQAANMFKTIIDWRNVSKQDSNSMHYLPNFVNGNGNSNQVNLHLANPNPAEGQGIADPLVTDDLDGDIRSNLSPVDIGADAGNFTYQDGDAPRISHEPFLGNPVPTSYIYKVKITDNGSGVDTSGTNKPRMWFRKKHPTLSAWASLPGQLISGQVNNGIWGFVPDFAGAGVPVSIGDSLEYYFAAQDKGPVVNVGFSNVVGTAHNSVAQQVSPPQSPLRLLIYGWFPDTVYVGNGQTYPSLTNDNGFFHLAKTYMFDTSAQHPTIVITSDLTETGTHEYTNLNATGPTIKITTLTPTVKKIQGNINSGTGMVILNRVKDILLDGSVNGSGRYLHFISGASNSFFTLPAIRVILGKGKLRIRNLILESNGTSAIGESMGFYNTTFDSVVVENCLFKDIQSNATAAIGMPNTGLYALLDTARTFVIRHNEFTNFRQSGIQISQGALSPAGIILIDSNHFYHNSPQTPNNRRTAMDLTTNVFLKVSHNYIGGSAPYCGGTPWTFPLQATESNAEFQGIGLNGSTYLLSSIQGNTIQNIRFTNFGINFYGIKATNGMVDIGTDEPNLIGSLSSDSSIVNKFNVVGIYGRIAISSQDTPFVRIWNNIIAGATAPYLEGINLETRRGNVMGNRVENLTASGTTLAIPGFKGMKIWMEEGKIEANTIVNLKATLTNSSGWLYGLDAVQTAAGKRLLVARNRISGLRTAYTGFNAQLMYGIRFQSGQYDLYHNQVHLDNDGLTANVDMRGIQLEGVTATQSRNRFVYNTVHLAGTTGTNNNSYGIHLSGGSPLGSFHNNLVYNERIGGTGKHVAIGNLSLGGADEVWLPASANNNLYVVSDTNFVNEYHGSGVVNIRNWRTLVGSDSASYAALTTDVPSADLFNNPSIGDLNINTANDRSWYVNGKGLPILGVGGDFDSAAGVRSTLISDGATDIGSDEFDTPTAPPALVVSGARVPGGTEYFSLNGRVVASITWGNTGTLPTLGDARFYSGVWPNDTTNNGQAFFASFMNGYFHFPATGGSNYSYNLTFHYDSSMLGKVINPATIVINKRQTGVNGSWQSITPTMVNTALQTLTIQNQNSFSEFTATDATATLVSGSPTPDLTVSGLSISGTPSTGTSFTANWTINNIGTGASGNQVVKFYLSSDAILTPGANQDILLGQVTITTAIAAQSNSGSLNQLLAVPCSLNPGIYKLFVVADADNTIAEMLESNNQQVVEVSIVTGVPVPQKPVITANPELTVCQPQTITLTANSSNCSSCTYNWNTGATGTSLVASVSGVYKVTVSNTCGQAADSVTVTINSLPTVNITRSDTTICAGSSITLSATGASSYQWSPAGGLSASSGATVTAAPTGTTTYTVTGTSAAGCVNTDQVTISIQPTVTPAVNINVTGCPGNNLQFTATPTQGGTAPTYAWLVNNTPSGTGPTFNLNNASNGTVVTVNMTSNAVCASPTTATDAETVNCIITAIPNIDGVESLVILPNPSQGIFYLQMKLNQTRLVRYEIYDLQGHRVRQQQSLNLFGNQRLTLDLSEQASGMYILQLTVGKERLTVKLIVQ